MRQEGKPGLINPSIHLSQIEKLKNISIDELSLNSDTIKGLITTQKQYFSDNCLGMNNKSYCIDTNFIHLILSDGKINEILYYTCSPKGRILFDCFCMDETHNPRPYKKATFTKRQLDSILLHKNDFK